jgi:hypothetical protein
MVPLSTMTDHRVRLTDADLDLVVAALRARAAGVGLDTALRCLNLAMRLDERHAGNPWQRHDSITALVRGKRPAKRPKDDIAAT